MKRRCGVSVRVMHACMQKKKKKDQPTPKFAPSYFLLQACGFAFTPESLKKRCWKQFSAARAHSQEVCWLHFTHIMLHFKILQEAPPWNYRWRCTAMCSATPANVRHVEAAAVVCHPVTGGLALSLAVVIRYLCWLNLHRLGNDTLYRSSSVNQEIV